MTTINPEHLLITAPDGLLLPALYYRAQKAAKILAVYVHGSGSSSIIRTPKLNGTFAEKFSLCGIDFLTFNNRGAGYITKFDSTEDKGLVGGMTYEKIEDFATDLRGVEVWAKMAGYEHLFVLGHSTGANKVVSVMSNRSDSFISGIALMSGGDDVFLQRERYDPTVLEEVQDMLVKKRESSELVSPSLFPGEHPVSWRSLGELITLHGPYDIFPFARAYADQISDHFTKVKDLKVPTVFVYGSEDFGTVIRPVEAIELLKKALPGSNGILVADADHSFSNREDLLADHLVSWMSEVKALND